MAEGKRKEKLLEQKEIVSETIEAEVNELINEDIAPTNKRGKYTPLQVYEMIDSGEYRVLANKIYRIASTGALRKTIRKKLGISTNLWQDLINLPDNKFPQGNNLFKAALTKGEINGCYVVADALKETALGYEFVEKNVKYIEDEDGNITGKKNISVFHKYQPGNVKAQTHYLSKKLPDEWGIVDGTIINNDNRVLNITDIQNMPKNLREQLLKFIESQSKSIEENTNVEEVIEIDG